jgi:hypothetical protein
MLILEPLTADHGIVVHRGLVLCSYICCALVIASFAMFARDQLSGASKHQVAQIASGTPTTPGEAPASGHHGAVRRFIDNASNALTSPFRGVFQSGSQWAKRIFALVCAMLVYGLGLGYLARYSQGVSSAGSGDPHRWRVVSR